MSKRPYRKQLRDQLFTWLLHGLIFLVRRLPRRAAITLMRAVGRLVFRLDGRGRRRTVRHLTIALGAERSGPEIERLAGRVYRHFGTVLADVMRMPVLINQGLNRLIVASGIRHLDAALASGQGVLMITGHFGNWELLGAWMAQNGYPVRVVGSPLENPGLNRIVVGMRNQAGYVNIARGEGTREIIRSLRRGCAVGMLIDQDTKVPGVFVSFFGRPAHTPTGPVLLARKFGLPIIPIFMYLKDDLTYQIECQPPLALRHTEDEARDILANTQLCSEAYERIIRRFPEQWVWMHKRWKTEDKSAPWPPPAAG